MQTSDGKRRPALSPRPRSKLASYTAPKAVLGEVPVDDSGEEGGSFMQSRRIIDRESEYSKRRWGAGLWVGRASPPPPPACHQGRQLRPAQACRSTPQRMPLSSPLPSTCCRLDRMISPDRNDAFGMGDKTPDARVRT